MIYITGWGVDDICILLSGVWMMYVYYWVGC